MDTTVHHDMCFDNLLETQTKNAQGEFISDVIGIKFGETGYYTTTYQQMTTDQVDALNARLGITVEEKLTMETCSMVGNWQNYDVILSRIIAQRAKIALQEKVATK